jgi:predicted ArsR family transcriptional regulator
MGATVEQIAQKFNISEAQVRAYIEQLESADRDTVTSEMG